MGGTGLNDAAFAETLARAFARFTAFLGARVLDAAAIRESLLQQRISAVTEARV